jgi:hypothetical protein
MIRGRPHTLLCSRFFVRWRSLTFIPLATLWLHFRHRIKRRMRSDPVPDLSTGHVAGDDDATGRSALGRGNRRRRRFHAGTTVAAVDHRLVTKCRNSHSPELQTAFATITAMACHTFPHPFRRRFIFAPRYQDCGHAPATPAVSGRRGELLVKGNGHSTWDSRANRHGRSRGRLNGRAPTSRWRRPAAMPPRR